ncbi:MAG TPA: extracellular solute-binding protein [Bacilli bacterium]
MSNQWFGLKKWAVVLIALTVIVAMSACGNGNTEGSGGTASSAPETTASNDAGNTAATNSDGGKEEQEKITLTFFTNNSDRNTGQGKVEQILIDQYMKEHPNITIKVETLSPDPQFQDKIKVYNASTSLPDIISAWGNVNYLGPLVANNALAELNRGELENLGFIPAALDSFSVDGKLYGFPRNSDFFVIYYNKKIFADNGLQVPKTEAELLDIFQKLKAKNIVPIAMDGQDAWVSGIWFDTMVQRAAGTWEVSHKAMDRSGSFKNEDTIMAARHMQQWIDAGAYGLGFLNQDYGTARNVFGQGKAAMYMMGEWEMGMASDENFPEEVRNNIGAFPFPSIEGGKGTTGDLTAWFGGGYAVSAYSKHKAEAIDFLKWMFRPDGWAKQVWVNGVTFPAQKYDQFMTGNETNVQKDLTQIFSNAKSYSGTVNQDKFTPDTQTTYYNSIQKLEGKQMTPEQFVEIIDQAAEQSANN